MQLEVGGILAQVSGTDISLLLGTFEVVGAEAVVIIANPNGISCNACNFINASRVDLVTAELSLLLTTLMQIDSTVLQIVILL